MAIVETFMGCGAWDLKWVKRPPGSVIAAFGSREYVDCFKVCSPTGLVWTRRLVRLACGKGI